MTAYVALLRAVNVGGTGKLPMAGLSALCEAAGFDRVSTYIASGNVVFRSDAHEAQVRSALEARLEAYAGRRIGVIVRSAAEVAGVLARNPFPEAPGSRVLVLFVDAPLPADAWSGVTGRADEDVRRGERELFVHYAGGVARSRLRIPCAASGTARNLNTVGKLAGMAAALA